MATRIVVNRSAVKALMRSPEMQADLKRRADAIADAAGDGHATDVSAGTNRARATVVTTTFDAIVAESQDNNLTRAIDAGRS